MLIIFIIVGIIGKNKRYTFRYWIINVYIIVFKK